MSENKKMTTCKSCGAEIARSAKACPHCGAKNKKPKLLFLICVIVVILILAVSCGGSEDPENPSQSAETTTAEPKEITYTEVTAGELINALDANALNAADTYTGNYYAVTGKLTNIDSSGSYISIDDPDNAFTFTNITCYIKTEAVKDVVKDLSTDEIITVKGQITDVGEVLGYSLNIDSIE